MSKRAKREVETPEYAAMIRRLVRAHGRRVAQESPEDLADMLGVLDAINAAVVVAVAGQRQAGFSWAQIAAPLGITREAAYMRWARAVAEVLARDMSDAATVPAHDDAC